MYLVSGLVPGPSLGPGLGLEKVPVFGPNRPSRCLGCQVTSVPGEYGRYLLSV